MYLRAMTVHLCREFSPIQRTGQRLQDVDEQNDGHTECVHNWRYILMNSLLETVTSHHVMFKLIILGTFSCVNISCANLYVYQTGFLPPVSLGEKKSLLGGHWRDARWTRSTARQKEK